MLCEAVKVQGTAAGAVGQNENGDMIVMMHAIVDD